MVPKSLIVAWHVRTAGRHEVHGCEESDSVLRGQRLNRICQFLLLTLLIAGCGRCETKLRNMISGNWVRGDGGFEINFSPDGSFVSQWTNSNGSVSYQGTWTIQDGSLITTLTNSVSKGITNYERGERVDNFRIIRADSATLVYSNENQIVSLSRK